MQFDQGLGQWQAKAGSFVLAVEVAVHLTKLRESIWNILRRDADTSIDDLKHEAALRSAPRIDGYCSTGFGVLDRVGQQVGKDLLQLAFVGAQIRQVLLNLQRQSNVVFLSPLPHQHYGGFDSPTDIKVLFVKFVLSASILDRSNLS